MHSLQSEDSRQWNGRMGEVIKILNDGYRVRMLPPDESRSKASLRSRSSASRRSFTSPTKVIGIGMGTGSGMSGAGAVMSTSSNAR